MGAKLLQPSFTGGELSPSLYARVDLARYGVSLRQAKNFLVRPYGGVSNRPGFRYIAETNDSTKRSRLIPFVYSTEVAYVIELGDLYMRFFALAGQVVSGDPAAPVEIVTPWGEDEIDDVRYTQSADIMVLTHPDHPPQRLSRTGPTTFVLSDYVTREGPFRDLNFDEAVHLTASAKTGAVTVTANADVFTEDMVGSFVYLEQKELTALKPWTQSERGIVVGDLRRSDGKTYMATNVPSTGGSTWTETGNVRPTHEDGRAWDGGGDQRTNGTQTWNVGVEWEYQDSGYGIVQITGFTDAKTVAALVTRNLPAACVGGLGAPGGTWNLVGDGASHAFAIAGATSTSRHDYTVTIDGVPVQSNPSYVPPPGSGTGVGGSGNGGFYTDPP